MFKRILPLTTGEEKNLEAPQLIGVWRKNINIKYVLKNGFSNEFSHFFFTINISEKFGIEVN